MMHAFFDRWQDDFGNVRMNCQECGEGHTFKNDYFAKQWANRHSYGITFGKIHGKA